MDQYQNIPSFKKSLQQSRPKWTFIWVLATIFSVIIGVSLLDAASKETRLFLSTIPGALIFGILWGAFVGFFQWLVLRVRAAKAIWWIPFNAAAYPLMLLGMHLTDKLADRYWDQLTAVWYREPPTAFANIIHTVYGDIYLMDVVIVFSLSIVFGLILGITQWLALRMLQPLLPEDDPLDDTPPSQTPLPPRRISAWWIPIHTLCTSLAAWMAIRAGTGEMPVIFFLILYGTLSGITFALFLRLLLPPGHKA